MSVTDLQLHVDVRLNCVSVVFFFGGGGGGGYVTELESSVLGQICWFSVF